MISGQFKPGPQVQRSKIKGDAWTPGQSSITTGTVSRAEICTTRIRNTCSAEEIGSFPERITFQYYVDIIRIGRIPNKMTEAAEQNEKIPMSLKSRRREVRSSSRRVRCPNKKVLLSASVCFWFVVVILVPPVFVSVLRVVSFVGR
ncbi:unnamed protein product [Caenorhabditis nigoni]